MAELIRRSTSVSSVNSLWRISEAFCRDGSSRFIWMRMMMLLKSSWPRGLGRSFRGTVGVIGVENRIHYHSKCHAYLWHQVLYSTTLTLWSTASMNYGNGGSFAQTTKFSLTDERKLIEIFFLLKLKLKQRKI